MGEIVAGAWQLVQFVAACRQANRYGSSLIERFNGAHMSSGIGKYRERQLMLPLGVRIVDALCEMPIDEVRRRIAEPGAESALQVIAQALSGKSRHGYSHSVMCAVSLPARRPKDESQPVVRRDGNYSLVITPRKRLEPTGANGEMQEVCKGVPFGPLARVILFYIMSEAVRNRSREVFLGSSFSEWLRRMGIEATRSGGERSSRRLVQDQIDRLMNCEWTFRYDGPVSRKRDASSADEGKLNAFVVNDMRLATRYAGLQGAEGSFVGCFVLSEEFYESLIEHSVPLAENAVKALKASTTALDLYAWLSYRLPRILEGQEVRLSWADVSVHFGSATGSLGKFRQLIREAWNDVACVYPQARHSADFSGLVVKLRHADAPTKGQMVLRGIAGGKQPDPLLPGLEVFMPQGHEPARALTKVRPASRQRSAAGGTAHCGTPGAALVGFPEGQLRYGEIESQFYEIGLQRGSPWDVQSMADAFRKGLRDINRRRTLADWKQIWGDFCSSYAQRRR